MHIKYAIITVTVKYKKWTLYVPLVESLSHAEKEETGQY